MKLVGDAVAEEEESVAGPHRSFGELKAFSDFFYAELGEGLGGGQGEEERGYKQDRSGTCPTAGNT